MKTPRLKFNVSDMRLPFIILMLSSHMLSGQQQSGDDYNDGEVGGCHSNNYFPCYEDCCRRGDMFCHRAEERCLSCSTRTAHCGNDSLVPPECLHYCYLLHNPSQLDSNKPVPVKEDYFYCTIVLGVGFFLALLVIVVLLLYIRRNQLTPSASNSSSQMTVNEKDSLVGSSDISRDEELQTVFTTLDTPPNCAPLPPHNPPHHPTTTLLDHLTSSGAEIPLLPPPSGQSDTMLLTRETAQPFGYNVNPAPPPPPSPPNPANLGNAAGEEHERPQDTQVKTPAGGGQGPPAHQASGSSTCQGHPMVCRDSRLDNVRPTADTDHEVNVLTNVSQYQPGQGLPYLYG